MKLANELTWPEPYRESLEYCLDENDKLPKSRKAKGHYQRNLNNSLAMPQLRCTDAVIHSKGVTE